MEEKLELKWEVMEKEKKELEAKIKEMEKRLEALADNMEEEKEELETGKTGDGGSSMEGNQEVSLRKGKTSNFSSNAVTKPSPRDLPIVLISAWQPNWLQSPQTVTFESFLANFNNTNRSGGLDLESGIFTCNYSAYYSVSFSAYCNVGPSNAYQYLYLYKNGIELPESEWMFYARYEALNQAIGVTGSRILVSDFF